MIIGVSVGEGEGALMNKIREKFQASWMPTVSKTKTAKYKVHARTGNIVISVCYKS